MKQIFINILLTKYVYASYCIISFFKRIGLIKFNVSQTPMLNLTTFFLCSNYAVLLFSSHWSEYFSLIFLAFICFFVAFCLVKVSILISKYVKKTTSYKNTNSAYECGFLPSGDSRGSVQIHFYIIALMFAIFDIEIALLLPWAFDCTNIKGLNSLVVLTAVFFLGCGLVYEIASDGLSWFFSKIKESDLKKNHYRGNYV